MTAVELDKTPATIRDMFAGVAPRYDLLNHLLSGSLDRRWRRLVKARFSTGLESSGTRPLLDLCCGTGDQALSLGQLGRPVVGADFCVPMVALARRKRPRKDGLQPSWMAADALEMPFPDERFSGLSVAFGVRNLADLDRGLREMARTLQPGGRLLVLEFALPRATVLSSLYLFYLRRVLPLLGRILSPRGSAYGYLRDSVLAFPQRDDFTARMSAAGFEAASWTDLSLGTVCLYEGTKPSNPPGGGSPATEGDDEC